MTIMHNCLMSNEFNQTKYINEYIKETYDVVKIQFPKGYKDTIKAQAKEKGYKSMNAYIKALIDNDINRV